MPKKMWLIWKEPKTRRCYVVGELTYEKNKFTFKYIDPEISDAKKVNFKFFPGFEELSKKYESSTLFVNIATRLPNKARPDYLEILNEYNLNTKSTMMEILEKTRGRLITDNYEFVPVFTKDKIEFDIAGIRYYDIKECKDLLEINSELLLELEPTNIHDKYSIKVKFNHNNCDYHLGYVPKYYSKQLTELLENNTKYSAMIESLIFNQANDYITVKLIFDK